MIAMFVFFFFFSSRRRHTRFDCDWSSDVCSSDLPDRGRIEQNVGTLQGREARAFGIPLVPTHQGADRADLRVERAKAKIAGREVELLVVRGIIGDMHL